MKFATLLTPSGVYMSKTPFFKDTAIGPMIPKDMKYNLHCGEVRGNILPPSHGTNTSCSEVKYKSKRSSLETKNTLQIENGSLSFNETLHKQ